MNSFRNIIRKMIKFDVVHSSEVVTNASYFLLSTDTFCTHQVLPPNNTRNPKISLFASTSPYEGLIVAKESRREEGFCEKM